MKTELALLAMYLGETRPIPQPELARYLGVSTTAVSHWNTGKFTPMDAPRSLIELSVRVGEADVAMLRSVASMDAGTDGAGRLVRSLGVRRTVAMIGRLEDTRTTRRLACLVETLQALAPGLLEPVTPPSAPVVTPAAPVVTPAAPVVTPPSAPPIIPPDVWAILAMPTEERTPEQQAALERHHALMKAKGLLPKRTAED